MERYIQIKSCTTCPFYFEENNYMRGGVIGVRSKCKVQDNKELDFVDKMDVTDLHDRVHESCKLDIL